MLAKRLKSSLILNGTTSVGSIFHKAPVTFIIRNDFAGSNVTYHGSQSGVNVEKEICEHGL